MPDLLVCRQIVDIYTAESANVRTGATHVLSPLCVAQPLAKNSASMYSRLPTGKSRIEVMMPIDNMYRSGISESSLTEFEIMCQKQVHYKFVRASTKAFQVDEAFDEMSSQILMPTTVYDRGISK